jgi:hypothetical protein
VSSLGCVVRHLLYWVLWRLIPDLTVGIWRSCLIASFGTYQDASVIIRRVFDWKRSRISMLDVDVVPQSCMP